MKLVARAALAAIVVMTAGCGRGSTDTRRMTVSLGEDQTALTGDMVYLAADVENASGSLTFEWSFLSVPPGSTAGLLNPQTSTASFVADAEGEFVLQLSVADETSHATSTVGVSVLDWDGSPYSNEPPVADADGPPTGPVNGQFANNAGAVLLDGTRSSDPDGDPLSYEWGITAKPLGSVAILNDPTLAQPSLIIDKAGQYDVVLHVFDGISWSGGDSLTVLAAGASQVMIAAGDSQSERVGTTLPVPVTVLVTNEFGDPIEGIAVLFDVAAGLGGDAFAAGADHSEADGLAFDSWTLGTVTGGRSAIATAITYIDNLGNASTLPPVAFNANGRSGLAVDFTLDVPASGSVDDGIPIVANGFDVFGNFAKDDHDTMITLKSTGSATYAAMADMGTVLAGGNDGFATVRIAGGVAQIRLDDTDVENVVVWIGDQTYSSAAGPFPLPPEFFGDPADLAFFSFPGVPLATEEATLVLTGRGDFGGGQSLTVADAEVFEYFIEAFGSAPNCSPSAVTESFPVPFGNLLGLTLDGQVDLVAANLSGYDEALCDDNDFSASLSFSGAQIGTTTAFEPGLTAQIVLLDPRDVEAGNSSLLEAFAADQFGNLVPTDDVSRFDIALSGSNASFAITAAEGMVVSGSGNLVSLRVENGVASIDVFNAERELVLYQLGNPIPSTLVANGTQDGRFTGFPDQVVVVSGDGQSGTVGQPLSNPIVLEVLDDEGFTVPDAFVFLDTTLNDGFFDAADPISDRDGRVFATFILGTVVGANEGSASVFGSTDAFVTATGVEAAPHTVRLLSVPPLASGEDVATVVVEVWDEFGNVVGSDDSTTFSVETNGAAFWSGVDTGTVISGLGSQVVLVTAASGVVALELTDPVDGDTAGIEHFDSLGNGLNYTADGGSVSVSFPP